MIVPPEQKISLYLWSSTKYHLCCLQKLCYYLYHTFWIPQHLFPFFQISLRTCYTKFCDNLLAYTDFSTLFWVSFCVIRNCLDFNESKPKDLSAQSTKSSMPLRLTFKMYGVVVSFLVAQNYCSLRWPSLSFQFVAD